MIDIVLDRYCFKDMAKVAEKVGNDFLTGYVRTLVDVANVKALLRLRKMASRPSLPRRSSLKEATPHRSASPQPTVRPTTSCPPCWAGQRG